LDAADLDNQGDCLVVQEARVIEEWLSRRPAV
jgi:hypothetical protein